MVNYYRYLRRFKWIASFSLLGLILVLVLSPNRLWMFYNQWFLGNKLVNLDCEQLPTVEEVYYVLESNGETLVQLESLKPGDIRVDVEEKCPGRSLLVINYTNRSYREEIEALVGGETFDGVPYELYNR